MNGARTLPVGDIDFGRADAPVRSSLAARVQRREVVPAKGLDDLTESQTHFRSLDHALAAKLKLVATADAGGKVTKKVFIHEFVRWMDYYEGDEGVRVGVGLRFVFEATLRDAQLDIAGLAALAAAAELKMAETSIDYRIIGISGTGVNALHPTTDKVLSIDNYKHIADALDRARTFLEDPAARVAPNLLDVLKTASSEDDRRAEVREASALLAGLASLAGGETLAAALARGAAGGDDARGGVIRRTYRDVGGVASEAEAVPAAARERAASLLRDAGHDRPKRAAWWKVW